MRRREATLDPAVAAELEALEAALAGDPAAEPALAALVRDVRAEAPTMQPAARARLDQRVEQGFVRARSRRRFALRPMIPALGVAGCVVAAIVAIALTTSNGSSEDSRSGGGAIVSQSRPSAPDASDSAKSSGGSASAGSSSSPALAAPPAPARQRRVERSTRLELSATDVQKAADGVVRATQAVGGFVQSSQISTGDGRSIASFVLRVPTSRLDDALARLSRLGHVKALQQSADDITGAYDSAAARLAEARAARRSPTTGASCRATSASSTRCAIGPTTPPSPST